MARRRFRRAGSSGLKNNVWSVVILADVPVDDTPTVEASIVVPDEWQPALSGFEHATLLRVRGWLTATAPQGVTAIQTLYAMIYVVDVDDTPNNPSVATSYTEEDVLWTHGWAWGAGGAGSVEKETTPGVVVDVKAMRRIDSSKEVRLALRCNSTVVVSVSGVLRALIRKS